MGADFTINSRETDLGAKVMEITGGNGIQRICEASGHAPTLNKSFKWLRKGGKVGVGHYLLIVVQLLIDLHYD